MSYAKSFSIKKLVDGDISDEQKKLTYAIDTGVVFGTPVDTGRARLNWIVSNGKPDNTVLGPTGQGAAAGNTAINAANSQIRKIQPYSLTYIQNNLPYIDRLNNGWSAQAPAYFVERVITRVVKGDN